MLASRVEFCFDGRGKMSEPESLRQIAKRLIADHRNKKNDNFLKALNLAISPLEVTETAVPFTESDICWLKEFGIRI